MNAFDLGPFEYRPAGGGRWSVFYGHGHLGTRLPEAETRAAVVEALSDDVAAWRRELLPTAGLANTGPAFEIARLVRSTDTVGVPGETLGHMPLAAEVPGLTSGLIDDRFGTWLVCAGRATPMDPGEFSRLRLAHIAAAAAETRAAQAAMQAAPRAPALAWICALLPGAVLSTDPEEWRAPSSWELRHVIGEGSLTGISGAKAAALAGVTPQNFRKYTARDGAAGQQKISFAMWHLLLHRLNIQHLELA